MQQLYHSKYREQHHRLKHEEQLFKIAEIEKVGAQREIEMKEHLEAIERETEEKLAQLRATEKKKVVKAQLGDADSIELKLKEMKVELAPEKVAEFAAKQQYVSGILEQFEIGVNNNQFAVAVAAVCDPKSNKR